MYTVWIVDYDDTSYPVDAGLDACEAAVLRTKLYPEVAYVIIDKEED